MCDLPSDQWEWDCSDGGLPYFPGQVRNVISGHRDWRATACPGASLYDKLPDIRAAVYEAIHRPHLSVDVDPLRLERNTTDGYTGPLSGVSATDPDGDPVTLVHDAPAVLPLGDTEVTWTGTDPSDFSDTVTQTVRVIYTFTDDDGSTFERDIEWIATEGITRGCNPPANDRYCPDTFVTRGQMAAFLVRALGYTDDGDGDLFIDDDGTIFEHDIDKLGTAGVTKGCNPPTNDLYCPDERVTRGQMAAFLVRALGYTDDGDGDLFIDDDGTIFEHDIDKLGTAGVTKGCNPPTNDLYCPNAYVTRGQMAAFLRRALDT